MEGFSACVDKIALFVKTCGSKVIKAGVKMLTACKIHAPLIALIGGTVLAVSGFIMAWIWRKKAGELGTQHIIKTIAPIALFTAGMGLQILSFVISSGRINALSKALAAALDAGAVLGTAKLSADFQQNQDRAEAVEVARDAFSRKIVDQRYYNPNVPYGGVENILSGIRHCRTRLTNFGSLTWNDVLKQLGYDTVDEGYTIGWRNKEDFGVVFVDNFGNEVDQNGMVRDALWDNIKNYRIYFQGMQSLVDPNTRFKVTGEV